MACVGLTAAGRWGGGDGYCARTVAGVGGAEVTSCPWAKASQGQGEIWDKQEGPINLALKKSLNLKLF